MREVLRGCYQKLKIAWNSVDLRLIWAGLIVVGALLIKVIFAQSKIWLGTLEDKLLIAIFYLLSVL